MEKLVVCYRNSAARHVCLGSKVIQHGGPYNCHQLMRVGHRARSKNTLVAQSHLPMVRSHLLKYRHAGSSERQ